MIQTVDHASTLLEFISKFESLSLGYYYIFGAAVKSRIEDPELDFNFKIGGPTACNHEVGPDAGNTPGFRNEMRE